MIAIPFLQEILPKVKALTAKLEAIELDKQKITAIIFVSMAVLFLEFSFVLKAQLDGIKSAAPKIVKLNSELKNLNSELGRMQELKGTQFQAQKNVLAKGKKVISEDQVPTVLKFISDVANNQGIRIEDMRPSKEGQPGKIIPDKMAPFFIALNAECDYHRLGKFFNEIENGDIFLEISNFRINSDPSNYFKQRVHVVVGTYIKK